MSQTMFLVWCVMASTVLGGFWGGLIALFHPPAGMWVGVMLFLLAFLMIYRRDDGDEFLEEIPRRRFND